jgi:ABC-type multidrug transport system fused ATPase/permease subunit
MMQRLILIGLVIVAAVLGVVAFNQSGEAQSAVRRADNAVTAQALSEDERRAAVTQAAAAEATMAAAQTAQAAANASADRAQTAQASAAAAAETADAAARSAEAARDQLQVTVDAAATSGASAITAIAAGDNALATAAAQINAQATEIVFGAAALATTTARLDLAEFARAAAEEDRTAALAQYRAAATALAAAEATFAAAAPPVSTAAASPTPAAAAPSVTPAPVTEVPASATPAASEPALTQTFQRSDGSLRFDYPNGWLVEEVDGQIFLLNTAEILNNPGQTLRSGQFIANILIGPASDVVGLDSGASARQFAEALVARIQQRAGAAARINGPSDLTLGSFEAARFDSSASDGQLLVIVVNLGDGLFALAFGNTVPGEVEQFEPALRQILATMQFRPNR